MCLRQRTLPVISVQVLAGVPDTCKVLRSILRHIKDMPQQLQRLQAQSTRDAKDFSTLTDSLANLLLLRSAVASAGFENPCRPGTYLEHVQERCEQGSSPFVGGLGWVISIKELVTG